MKKSARAFQKATALMVMLVIFISMEIATTVKAATELPYIPLIGIKKAPGPIYLNVQRNYIGKSLSVEKGEENVLLSDMTFTNYGPGNIYIHNPAFMSLSNETLDDDHSIKEQIKNFHLLINGQEKGYLYIIGGYILSFQETEIVINPNDSVNIQLKGDVSSNATANSLNFDLYCNLGSTFSINYGDIISPAPFNISGQTQNVYLPSNGGDPFSNVYSIEDSYYSNHYHNIAGTWAAPYIPEGTMIRAKNSIDVYIVKYDGYTMTSYKRLILSPSVFNSYKHLKWEDILEVDPNVLDYFATSNYVQAAGDSRIWKLDPQGDTGIKREITNTNGQINGIYEINATDLNSYTTGNPIISN